MSLSFIGISLVRASRKALHTVASRAGNYHCLGQKKSNAYMWLNLFTSSSLKLLISVSDNLFDEVNMWNACYF